MDGKLIVFEGANEVGKSTLAALLYTTLKSRGTACELVAFPGNEAGTLGRHIYELHHGANRLGVKSIDPTSLQLLHIAAHIDGIESAIKPALSAGKIVLLDRFWWSTIVYGKSGGANAQSLGTMVQVELNHWGEIAPDTVVLVTRSEPVTPLYNMADWRRIAESYVELAETERRAECPVTVLSNNGPLDETFRRLLSTLDLD